MAAIQGIPNLVCNKGANGNNPPASSSPPSSSGSSPLSGIVGTPVLLSDLIPEVLLLDKKDSMIDYHQLEIQKPLGTGN